MDKLDLDALDTKKGAEAGFEVQIMHPQTNAALPIWITVLGTDSDQYQTLMQKQQQRRADKMVRGRRLQLPASDEVEEDNLDLLAAVTKNWRTDCDLDGKPFPEFSSAAARSLYKRFRWMREQVESAIGDRANFLPKSAKA
jgi:hypothetical protein